MVAFVAGAALALAACGGSGSADAPPGETSAGGRGSEAIDPDREGPAAPIDGAVAGGTVTVLADYTDFGADAGGMWPLDPTVAYTVDTVSILNGLVTRSLTQYVYDPEQDAMVLVPDLATDIGTPNADFTEWSFTIRDGVRFEDGTEVTAEDVAYGIKRSLDRKHFPKGPAYSNDYFLDGDSYKGVYTSGTEYAGVVVEGDTLTIKMQRPFPDMPYWGTFPAMGPIPEQGSDPDTYGQHPLATGPYKFADYTPGESLTLVRNEEWDPGTDPGRHAYPDRYEFSFAPTERIETTILGDSPQGQTTLTYQNVTEENYRRARRLDRLTVGPAPYTAMWCPDYRKITDIRVRQAIGYAYPYTEDAEYFGQIAGVTRLFGSSTLPPGFPERQDYTVLDIEPGRADPDQAKVLLKQAGYAPGEYELIWPYIDDDPFSKGRTDLLVQSLEAAGFKTSPFPTSSADDFVTVLDDPDAPINLRPCGIFADWPAGNGWFPDAFKSEGSINRAYFAEPEVDAEIERISRLPIDEQPAAWAALDKTIMTDYYPAVITGYDGDAMPHGSSIGGMNNDNTLAMPTWKDIHVMQ
ncbi:MAG: ABC transporter substrate-binding protein [Actinomycetota bacterium]|nr:ABC transporter substrate-binding protein [Actinomycetota bacterium]